MIYPTLMYRCPGPHAAHNGQTYQFRAASSEGEAADLASAGWHMSLADAVQAVTAQRHEGQDEDSVTREELEEMATELGIKFDGRTTDAALLRKIESATSGGE